MYREGATMESRATQQAKEKAVTPSVLANPERHGLQGPPPVPIADPKAVGYGLPCSNCRAYYPSDLNACPVCKSPERVSAGGVSGLPMARLCIQPPLAAPPQTVSVSVL